MKDEREMKGPGHRGGWRKVSGRGNSLCRGPEVGQSLAGLWNNEEASVAGVRDRGEWAGGEDTEGTKEADPAGPPGQGADFAFTLSHQRAVSELRC